MDINIYDDIIITEEFQHHLSINVHDNIVTSESMWYAKHVLYISLEESISLMTEIVKHGFTPLHIAYIEPLITIAEYTEYKFSTVGLHVDEVSVTEVLQVTKVMNFNEILRSYPFTSRRVTGYVEVQYENGLIQERDTWGRTKMQFEIIFPPMTRQQALDVDDVFKYYKGKTFAFTNPVDGRTYNVRIVESTYEYERRYYNTFYARMTIEEV